MPLRIGQWDMDNFFSRPMELPRYLHDCYFFYYSKCYKGEHCPYRHASLALGHENVCEKWFEGKCLDVNCKDRHMIIEKYRSLMPCYWESTPRGCLKQHCVFKHCKNRSDGVLKTTEDNVAENVPENVAENDDEKV